MEDNLAEKEEKILVDIDEKLIEEDVGQPIDKEIEEEVELDNLGRPLNSNDEDDDSGTTGYDWEISPDYWEQLVTESKFTAGLRNVLTDKKKFDKTEQFEDDVKIRTQSTKKTDHVVIMITGIPGVTSTGIGKSSVGMIIAEMIDPKFNGTKIGFTNDEILDILKEQAEITEVGKEVSQCFVRDETPDSLKKRAGVEISTVIESLRDSKTSLILIKPSVMDLTVAHFVLVPICFNREFTKVKVAIYNPHRDFYRGFIILDVIKDNKLWKEYMFKKKEYQKLVAERKLDSFDSRKCADEFLNKFKDEFHRFLTAKWDKDADTHVMRFVTLRLKKHVSQSFPRMTGEERSFILDDLNEDLQMGVLYDKINLNVALVPGFDADKEYAEGSSDIAPLNSMDNKGGV